MLIYLSSSQTTTYVPNLSKLNYDELAEYLLGVDFSASLLSTDVEFIWDQLRSTVLDGIDLKVPKIKLNPKKHSPYWFNSKVRHQINCVRTIRRRISRNPTASSKCKLQEAELKLQDLMSSSKSSFESQLVEDFAFKNSNKIYRYINSIIKSDNLPVVMHLNNQSASTDVEKATLFNIFFESVYSKPEDSPFPGSLTNVDTENTLECINITDLDVFTALSQLDPTKASGIDGIGPKLLRSCALALYPVIHHLFTISLWYCKIPSEWKLHCIVPIFKSGDRSSVSNYRPISLLCCISKVLERLVYDKTIEFVGHSISKAQFGFLRKHSCLQQWTVFKIIVPNNAHLRGLWRETFLGPETEHMLLLLFLHFSKSVPDSQRLESSFFSTKIQTNATTKWKTTLNSLSP